MYGSIYLYAQLSWWVAWPQDISVRSKGWGSFDTEVYIFHTYIEVFNCGLVLIRLYMHIYMYVWTYLHMGSFGTKVYILGIYIWKYLACNLETKFSFPHIHNCGVGLKWNSSAGTLTVKCVAWLVTLILWENVCMPPCMLLEP